MDNNKNTIIAIVLMLAVWVVFTVLFPPQQQEPTTAEPDSQSQNTVPAGTQEEPRATAADTQVYEELLDISSEEKEYIVKTELYTAVFTNIGARLKYLELNNYRIEDRKDADLVSMIDVARPNLSTLRLSGVDGLQLSPVAPYSLPQNGDELTLAGDEKKDIVFSTRSAEGLIIEKILTVHGNSYAMDLKVRVRNPNQEIIRGALELSLVKVLKENEEPDRFTFTGGAALVGDELKTASIDDLEDESFTFDENTVWSAYEDKYFMSALVPLEDSIEKVVIQRRGDKIENVFTLPFMALNPDETAVNSFMAYFGPRDTSVLESVNYELSKAIDFGFFTIISEPLLWFMNLLYEYVHNYGIAIIALTVLIKLLFWPLTHKSYASMKSMQKLQPEIQKIKERFKNDRARQGQETMELYKKHRVNPMSGCLPMLIQIPVFIALYRVLYEAIELRHADFMFWITDLSAKDPYYITPLIMGATMFIQQKMTPSTMDATQQKIFLLMPVVFTVLFLNFPSGLVIYWLVNNLLTIAQQYYIHRKFA